MSHDQRPAAACDRLLDALALELLQAEEDEFGPRHGGRTLKAAADQVRCRIAQTSQRLASLGAPVCPEHPGGSQLRPTE